MHILRWFNSVLVEDLYDMIVYLSDEPRIKQYIKDTIDAYEEIDEEGFGAEAYYAFGDVIPTLGPQEKLLIIGHGTSEYRGRPAILGYHQTQEGVTSKIIMYADTFFTNIKDIFPSGYHGKVYINSCMSSDDYEDQVSFSAELYLNIRAEFPGLEAVYGRKGIVEMNEDVFIPDPDIQPEAWTEAQI